MNKTGLQQMGKSSRIAAEASKSNARTPRWSLVTSRYSTLAREIHRPIISDQICVNNCLFVWPSITAKHDNATEVTIYSKSFIAWDFVFSKHISNFLIRDEKIKLNVYHCDMPNIHIHPCLHCSSRNITCMYVRATSIAKDTQNVPDLF